MSNLSLKAYQAWCFNFDITTELTLKPAAGLGSAALVG